jgi:hypothetical protein
VGCCSDKAPYRGGEPWHKLFERCYHSNFLTGNRRLAAPERVWHSDEDYSKFSTMAGSITKPKSQSILVDSTYPSHSLTLPRAQVQADARPAAAQDREGVGREAAQGEKARQKEPGMAEQTEEGSRHSQPVSLQGEAAAPDRGGPHPEEGGAAAPPRAGQGRQVDRGPEE